MNYIGRWFLFSYFSIFLIYTIFEIILEAFQFFPPKIFIYTFSKLHFRIYFDFVYGLRIFSSAR